MASAPSPDDAEQRAREMSALDPTDRDVRIVFGVLSGVVTDGRGRFGRPESRQHRGIYNASAPKDCA